LQSVIAPAVTALGYELVGVEFLPQGRHSLLRVYIDTPDGVTVEDCERVSHQVSGMLDVEDPIRGAYTLEVSSPGLDRPLFTLEQFARYVGHEVKIRLHAPKEGRRKLKGTLTDVSDDGIRLEVDGAEVSLTLAEIDKANLVPQW